MGSKACARDSTPFLVKPEFTEHSYFVSLQGLSDVPGEAMVKLYCPKCMDVYTPKSSRHHHTDGAYFGTGFPHMLFMVHPEYRPKRSPNQFVPRFVNYSVYRNLKDVSINCRDHLICDTMFMLYTMFSNKQKIN